MKTIIVTGAAGGMGAAVTHKLVQEGIKVFAVDIRPVEIEGVYSYCCDMTDPSALNSMKNAFCSFSDHVDGIVHAAGIYDLDALSEISDERFHKIFEINVFAVYRINRLFTPLMSKGGRITIITSELGPLNPLPFTGLYAVTKAALEKYAYSFRTEMSLRGILVSIVRPGAVQTGLLNVSTAALDRFVANTVYFKPNANRFYQIVNSVEAKAVNPEKVADLVWKALSSRRPRYVYNINRNILLRIMSALPDHLQSWILRLILR